MNELELQLVDLGAAVEMPTTPDVIGAVRERLVPHGPRRSWVRRLRVRRPLVIAIAVGALLAGTAAAIPPVRHAIERLFGLNGAVVERVSHLPPGVGKLDLGRRIPVAEASNAASFRALEPLRGVDAAYVSAEPAGGRITLVIGRSLLIEFRGQQTPFIFKMIGPGARIRRLRVNGGEGLYLYHSPHDVLFANEDGTVQSDAVRLQGSVLLWQQGPLILRIEHAGSLAQALALARSLR